jgi:hypothetical protein
MLVIWTTGLKGSPKEYLLLSIGEQIVADRETMLSDIEALEDET